MLTVIELIAHVATIAFIIVAAKYVHILIVGLKNVRNDISVVNAKLNSLEPCVDTIMKGLMADAETNQQAAILHRDQAASIAEIYRNVRTIRNRLEKAELLHKGENMRKTSHTKSIKMTVPHGSTKVPLSK